MVIYKSTDINNNPIAIKRVELVYEDLYEDDDKSQINEFKILKKLNHVNILNMNDCYIKETTTNDIFGFMVTKLYKSSLCDKELDKTQIKIYMKQILKGIEHIHENKILHLDLKPENILIDNNDLVIADFGLATNNFKRRNEVVSLWYKAPELIIDDKDYTYAIDIWSVGCIFAEMIIGHPLFESDSITDHFYNICRVLSTPSEDNWKGVKMCSEYKETWPKYNGIGLKNQIIGINDDELDLLYKMIVYNPKERITASEALKHRYFD